jgi:hypothetical protein
MGSEELAHGEGTHAIGAEDLGHLLVGGEELLVLGILKTKTKKQCNVMQPIIITITITITKRNNKMSNLTDNFDKYQKLSNSCALDY